MEPIHSISKQYSIQSLERDYKHYYYIIRGKYGWEFLFLGANIDAIETARHFGIGRERAVSYRSDHLGTTLNYEVIGEAVCELRCKASISDNWKKRINEDMKERK